MPESEEIRMDHQFIESQIVRKIQEILETTKDISPQDDLSALGLNSIKSVALIVELEEAFDITFDDEELLFENFSDINRIAERVQGKLVIDG